MADIQRGIKSFGTRKFASERAAAPGNKAPILSAEVDVDFDTLYNAWNAGIDVTDLKPGFIITHTMLGNDAVESNNIKDGTITLADMGPNSVDSSKIVDGSIAAIDLGPNSVTTVKILDGNVTKEKLAPGASLWNVGGQRIADVWPGINIAAGATQAGYLSVANQARTAGLSAALTIARIHLHGQLISADTDGTITALLLRNGVQFDSTVRHYATNNTGAGWEINWEVVLTPISTAPITYSVNVVQQQLYGCQLQGGSLIILAYS